MNLLCALLLLASDGKPLLYLGLNAQGAEEWYRPRDGAVVIRVPKGDYLRRPYEGREATAAPKPFPVESFFIDKCEVTNAQFALFLDGCERAAEFVDPSVGGVARGADGKWAAEPGRERHPFTAATGHGMAAYADWVSGRLPTQPEWEKAAGGEEGLLYPWGESPPDSVLCNFGRPAPRGTEPVGSHAAGASPYGCLDMAGNVYDRVSIPGRGAVMLKGGSWLSPHPLNLRVLDLCMQPMGVAERSVGFRCAMDDPEPGRPRRGPGERIRLRLARDWDSALKEAKERKVPIFLSLQYDTCGQCDRTRAQCFEDPRFIAFFNENAVVVTGHQPGDAVYDPHPPGEGGLCPLYPGLTCDEHEMLFAKGFDVVRGFSVSPGNFLLDPFRAAPGAGRKAVLVPEGDLPKWGNAVEVYLAALERARKAMAGGE
jgi:formylglycine-generating enzyme required for sulfatase activity